MVHALPDDGNRYEVIDGELLVSPAPSLLHQAAVVELTILLSNYAKAAGLRVYVAPAAVTWSDRTELQPDVLAIPLAGGKPAKRFEDVGILTLAVEVLSPSTMRVDRSTKRREYQRRGVNEFWIVDPHARSIERWRPNDKEPEILFDTISWQPDPGIPPLVLDLAQYFREVHDE